METFREALITEPGKIILHEVEKKTQIGRAHV